MGTESLDRKITTVVNAQFFHHSIEGCEWLKYQSFAPGGWAMDNAALYTLYRVLNDAQPQKILEFGLGQSSKMVHQFAVFQGNCQALTVEHDAEWIDFFTKGVSVNVKLNIERHDTVLTIYNGKETLTYKGLETLKNALYDFIIVDGPFGSGHYSRSQIIEMAKTSLAEKFVIFIDDTERNGEKETIQEIRKVFTDKNINYCIKEYNGEKNNHTVICSVGLKFLTSLR